LNLLLDTHVFLWWQEDSPRLGKAVRRAIAGAPVAYVSAASAWEIAIKLRLGKLRIPAPPGQAVVDSGFEELPIRIAHAEVAAALPDHHTDPFDRMLVAQARVEGLKLVTHDRAFAAYGIDALWT
jgi:PIN domain nuclease of toxin-antitoxin system